MENGSSRYVSAGALVLVACTLLIALVGSLSILASNFDQPSSEEVSWSTLHAPLKAIHHSATIGG